MLFAGFWSCRQRGECWMGKRDRGHVGGREWYSISTVQLYFVVLFRFIRYSKILTQNTFGGYYKLYVLCTLMCSGAWH